MWFSDEGGTPAIGTVTRHRRIREFSAGLLSGSQPAVLTQAADGALWFSDEGTDGALGRVSVGAPAALRTAPSLSAAPRIGVPVRCRPARWARWAHLSPSTSLFGFDGYRWFRGRSPIPGPRTATYTPTGADRGRRLSCRETVSYPAPFELTAWPPVKP